MKTLIVPKKYEKKRISNFVLDTFPSLKKSIFYQALRKKDIRVNGKRIHQDQTIQENDTITLFIADSFLFSRKLSIVYEDNYILVVDKPVAMEVTGPDSLTTLVKKSYPHANPCHRLDRNTTGLVLFAKDYVCLSILLDKFKKKEIEKKYFAKVYGIPKVEHALLESYLFKDRKKALVYLSDTPKPGYQKIKTEYFLFSKNLKENTSILSITLHTGKTHQIRAHLAHIGLPIIGDGKYGDNRINKEFHQTTQLLDSYSLKFHFVSDSGILQYLNGKEIQKECLFS